MAEHDQIQDPQDDIIASLRIQLQLQEQRETGMVRNYVELLLGRIEGLPPQGQQALIPLAMQNEYQIIESRMAARRAELQLLNHQYETRGVQYEQLQQQHRELSMAVNAFSAGSVPQHSTYNIFHGQLAGNVPPEAVAQGPPHELASHPAPVAAQTESDVSPHDLPEPLYRNPFTRKRCKIRGCLFTRPEQRQAYPGVVARLSWYTGNMQ